MKLNKYVIAAAVSGATVGGWVGYVTGAAHVAYNRSESRTSSIKMNNLTTDYLVNLVKENGPTILAHNLGGTVIGGLAVGALYRRRRS